MRDLDDDIRTSLERLTDPPDGTAGMDTLWGDLVARRRKRRVRNGALAALPLLLVAVLAVGVFSVRDSDDARSDVATGGADPASLERWERLPDAPISKRTGAVAVATDDEFVIWGGRSDSGVLNDGAAYSFDDGTWRTIDGPLSPRENAVAIWTGEEVLVWGGTGHSGSDDTLFDGAAWDPDTGEWERYDDFIGAVNGETAVAAVGGEVVFVGVGVPPNMRLVSDVFGFDPNSGDWRPLDRFSSGGVQAEFAAFSDGGDVLVAAITDGARASVARLESTTGTWSHLPLTWETGSPLDADDITWTGSAIAFVGHDTPGTLFDPSDNDGSASNIPATRSGLRLSPVALDKGIVTVGDKWFDTNDGSVDIYTGTWADAQAVPEDLDSSAVTVAHDGKLYAWDGSGYVWAPPAQTSGTQTTGTLRVEGIKVFGNGPLEGGTERAIIELNEPLPVAGADYVADITAVDAESGMVWTAQGPDTTHVCDSRHSVPQGAVGSVDLLVPASWFAEGEEAHTGPGLETVDEPAKFPICGPHNGFIQYAMWAPLSADPDDVTVTVSPDRTSITIEIASEAGETVLDPVAGQGVVAQFLDQMRDGDLEAAAENWTGYPELGPDSTPADRLPYIEELLADPTFTRILESDSTLTFVVPSTGEGGQVVTVLDARTDENPPAAIAFLTGWSDEQGSPGHMWIHRLPLQSPTDAEVDLPAGAYVQPGQDIVVPGVPLEGGARAFLNDQEVPVEVDYDNLDMTISIPDDVEGDIAVTIVTSSPELPGVRAFAVTVRR